VIAKGGVAHQPIEDHSLQRADERVSSQARHQQNMN
jgi:hypothetical protein